MTSAENVRFFTGVQRMMPPIWPMLKSGLQVVIPAVAAPSPARALQMRASSAVAILQLGVCTVNRAAPVGIEVVVERTAHTPGLNRGNAGSGRVHTVSDGREANALVGARQAGAAEHREVLPNQALEVATRMYRRCRPPAS